MPLEINYMHAETACIRGLELVTIKDNCYIAISFKSDSKSSYVVCSCSRMINYGYAHFNTAHSCSRPPSGFCFRELKFFPAEVCMCMYVRKRAGTSWGRCVYVCT